jgi:hypothetical protein
MAESNAGKVPAWYYAAGAAGVFLAYTLYKRTRKPAVSAAPTPAPASSVTPVVAAGSYGQDYTGAIQNLQTSISQLNQNQTSSPSSTTSAGTITATSANQAFAGGGFEPNSSQPLKQYTPVSSNSHVYTVIKDLGEALALGGGNLYYQPNPGQFSPIPGGSVNSLAAGTPFFRQVV